MENPYNRVAYQSSPFPQAHINRLATVGTLLGMRPPEIQNCRVLELGCGEGLHLIPMALEFPDAQFVGIDIAERPIARAVDLAAELGISNISFRVADLQQLSGQRGECDYLIAHGVYSWVSPQVQERMLDLCERILAENGIAYISYNAYPAWHVREMTRNMVRMHTAGVDDPVEILNRAVSLLAGIVHSQGEGEPYRDTIRAEMERIMAKDPALCFHDDFGEINLPVYFSEFVRRARQHGLQFLSEAEPVGFSKISELAPEPREALEALTDVIEREQYFDLLTCRGFRRTLLCRSDLALDRTMPLEKLKELHYAASLQCPECAGEAITSQESLEFQTPDGGSITVNQPFVKAAMCCLAREWPASLTFAELLQGALAAAPEMQLTEAESMLRHVLLRMHLPGVLELSLAPWRYTKSISTRPATTKLVRHQAK
ncbi:MAG: methyltransferase regulatory domain-containing protein, partial [Bryobacteraceae bacterium]|nr:methyltransferase regulatory domain-containing protein [Bryobacteraceae bacterium]